MKEILDIIGIELIYLFAGIMGVSLLVWICLAVDASYYYLLDYFVMASLIIMLVIVVLKGFMIGVAIHKLL